MSNLQKFANPGIKIFFTDIDDTLTDHGHLSAETYAALWSLKQHGIHLIPVTGRPAGWCEMIARQWPVYAVVGENGAFYFRYSKNKMKRHFVIDEKQLQIFRKKLDEVVGPEILKTVQGCALASDQFCRLADLAIDYSEDVTPLPKKAVDQIVDIFKKHGAHAKVSSIHVNGWFGEFNKLTTCKALVKNEMDVELDSLSGQNQSCFVGDSPNDEPSFEFFKNSFGVANVSKFLDQMKFKPRFIASKPGGAGFVEIANRVLGK